MSTELHELLLKVKERAEAGKANHGICYTMYAVRECSDNRNNKEQLDVVISRWPLRTKDSDVYPVPDPHARPGENPHWEACDAYSDAYYNGRLWDKETEYGRLRWELLDFLIKETAP